MLIISFNFSYIANELLKEYNYNNNKELVRPIEINTLINKT